jgi:hypothetical protein
MLNHKRQWGRPGRGYCAVEEDAMDYDHSPQQRRWRDLARDLAQGTDEINRQIIVCSLLREE